MCQLCTNVKRSTKLGEDRGLSPFTWPVSNTLQGVGWFSCQVGAVWYSVVLAIPVSGVVFRKKTCIDKWYFCSWIEIPQVGPGLMWSQYIWLYWRESVSHVLLNHKYCIIFMSLSSEPSTVIGLLGLSQYWWACCWPIDKVSFCGSRYDRSSALPMLILSIHLSFMAKL